jgi:alkanesulfonate monooxygenase SsuD/methylene tetrahydromethanopterin reductase-like flavin-dependent oxidoreductase (luciferase family)
MTASFGLDVPAFTSVQPRGFYQRLADAAAGAGFSNLWVGDHLLWHRPRFETFTLLGMLSGMSELTLGTGIALAPLRPPWWTAKSAASLAVLTGGRFILGLGAGGEYTREFEMTGTQASGRGQLVDDTIVFCRRSLGGELGNDFQPTPPSSLPIWVGGRKAPSLRRAARLADGWLGLFLSVDDFRACREFLEAHEPSDRAAPVEAAMALWLAVDPDPELARRIALDVIATEYRMQPERFGRYVVVGRPDDVRQTLAAYANAGATHLDLHVAHPDIFAQIDLLGEQVLPFVT